MSHDPYGLQFFRDRRGNCPARDYLEQLPEPHQAKAAAYMKLLQEEGPMLLRPYADVLRDKIRELRPGFGSYEHRFLYFFAGKTIVITHGFLKKTQAVPDAEIDFAIRCMDEWVDRNVRE